MTRTIHVPEISCGHCKQSIESEVGALADVSSVEVDIDAKDVHVEGDASDDQIRQAIEDAGFEVPSA